MKKHNFYAGPSILPQYTIDKTIEGIKDFAGSGLSVLEISHRSKEFVACMNDTIALVKELLEIPSGYQVIFLGGGASLQFAMVPMNMMNRKSAYLNTGECLHIPALTRHRIMAVEDSDIFEVSTPELDDVVRLDDDYGRMQKS